MSEAALAHDAPSAAPQQRRVVEHDHVVTLDGATWADFQRLLELRGEGSAPRFAYLEGQLQIMSPSRSHEQIKSMLGRLIEAYCMEREIDISPYGAWLLESKAKARGIEPDECYVLGDVDDPQVPDLAIEVIWTSGGIAKLEIYRKLGVREVWFWEDEALALYALRGETVERLERSELLPGLDHGLLLRFVGTQPMTRAVRQYRAALRE